MSVAQANSPSSKMRTFLLSSGYGALIGAGVGVVSLLANENPDKHMINIARGASLGLYAGMAYGLYINYAGTSPQNSDYTLIPRYEKSKLSGADFYWVAARF